jgi:hypothetical protein
VRDARLRDGLCDTLGALDVDAAQQVAAVVGLDHPGEVDDGVGPREGLGEGVDGVLGGGGTGDVDGAPLHPVVGRLVLLG